MTVGELRKHLAMFDDDAVIAINTIAERNKGLWPAADSVEPYGAEVGGEHYRCAVLTVSDWP